MSSLYGYFKRQFHKIPNLRIKNMLSSLLFKCRGLGDASEVYYWENYLSLKYDHSKDVPIALDKNQRNRLFPVELLEHINHLKRLNPDLQLLEVGSGPLSNLAWGVDQDLFKITAIDPLAHQYYKILKKNNYDYPIVPIKGSGETINEIFKCDCFDIIYSKNAIDHSQSPKKCIDNMYKVLKIDGIIFLEGIVNVGTNEDWKGLHQHDLIPQNGKLYRYDRMKRVTNLTSGLKLQCVYQNQQSYKTSDWYKIVFRKYA